jgi:hypothetical protein
MQGQPMDWQCRHQVPATAGTRTSTEERRSHFLRLAKKERKRKENKKVKRKRGKKRIKNKSKEKERKKESRGVCTSLNAVETRWVINGRRALARVGRVDQGA